VYRFTITVSVKRYTLSHMPAALWGGVPGADGSNLGRRGLLLTQDHTGVRLW